MKIRTPNGNPVEGIRSISTSFLDAFPRRLLSTSLAVTVFACGHAGPPPDFAPDPGLVAHIRELRMTAPNSICPGESFNVTYTAVLDDGSYVPFENRYDKDHPPRLHVMFLDRTSSEATPLQVRSRNITCSRGGRSLS